MHVAGSGTLKLPPMKSAPLDNSNDYCTLCGDGSQVLHLCDGKECNCVFLKLQMPVSFFFTYHTCVLSIILTYNVSYFARMIHSRMILDIPTLACPTLQGLRLGTGYPDFPVSAINRDESQPIGCPRGAKKH